MPGFVSWVLGIVFWVLGIVFWVSGIVFWVSGLVFWVSGFVFWVSRCLCNTTRLAKLQGKHLCLGYLAEGVGMVVARQSLHTRARALAG